jgi:hypothetical protein
LIAAVLGLFAEISGPPNARGESGFWSLGEEQFHLGFRMCFVLGGRKLSEHIFIGFFGFLGFNWTTINEHKILRSVSLFGIALGQVDLGVSVL